MFGPDTALMFEAIQIGVLAMAAGGTAMFLIMRRTKKTGAKNSAYDPARDTAGNTAAGAADGATLGPSDLESRVRVLERIATDDVGHTLGRNSADLAKEIEALKTKPLEGASQ